MSLSFNLATVFGAALIEAAAGYPKPVLDRIGHPVMWVGGLLDRLEARLNNPSLPESRRRLNGAFALGALLVVTVGAALILQRFLLTLLPPYLALLCLTVAASTLLAQRSLHDHVRAVANALEDETLEEARREVGKIVGRDTEKLDAAGVARAAIESLAENFSDGVVAPCLWGVVAGLPGMAVYKAINTADSMVGHRTPRFAAFGFAAAKLDDFLNLPASRLAALWLVLAAYFYPTADAGRARTVVKTDANRHRSPNAGWPEAAMAGALDLKLAGPRSYHGTTADDGWIGTGRSEATSADIRRALGLYRIACALQVAALGALTLLVLIARS